MDMEGAEGTTCFRKAATYPSAQTSRRLLWKRIWLLPPYNLPLAGVFGVAQVLLAFMLGLHLDDRHVDLGVGDLLDLRLVESPTAFVLITLMLALLFGMVRFAHDAPGVTRFLLGLAHSGMQLASIAGVMMVVSRLGGGSLIGFLALVFLLGGIGGTVGMSGYLWVTNHLGFHGNEGYAPLHHADLKHFLRLHVDASGDLTVYPVGIDRVGRHWELRPDDPPAAPVGPHVAGRPPPDRAAVPGGPMSTARVGCSGWVYKDWRGTVYPRSCRQDGGSSTTRACSTPSRSTTASTGCPPRRGRGLGRPGAAGVRLRR